MIFSLLNFVTPKGRLSRRVARDLYNKVVKQSRNPVFYQGYDVPDTPEGRFEMIALHAGLLVNRLCRPDMGNEGKFLAQALFDVMFMNLDWSIREMGVGDLGVPRRIKKMMADFKGRAYAYDEAVKVGAGELIHALSRNVYAEVPNMNPQALDRMALYVQNCAQELNKLGLSDFWRGQVNFPHIEQIEQQGFRNVTQAA